VNTQFCESEYSSERRRIKKGRRREKEGVRRKKK
jgi:hypothetical protein